MHSYIYIYKTLSAYLCFNINSTVGVFTLPHYADNTLTVTYVLIFSHVEILNINNKTVFYLAHFQQLNIPYIILTETVCRDYYYRIS